MVNRLPYKRIINPRSGSIVSNKVFWRRFMAQHKGEWR